VPADLVEGIKKRYNADEKIIQIEPFAPGEAVQLTRGPFADYIGTIEKIDRSRRVFILMEMMRAKARVVVEETQIRSV
jgi:transcriptional antiterminator RfaH